MTTIAKRGLKAFSDASDAANRIYQSYTDPRPKTDLEELENILASIIANITQIPKRGISSFFDKYKFSVGKIGLSQLGSHGLVQGAVGAVQTLGVAATGTPIATLSGAALQSATQNWFGSLIGLGAVGGGTMLALAPFIASVGLGVSVQWKVLGFGRRFESLTPNELEIFAACSYILQAIKNQDKIPMSEEEASLLTTVALTPLSNKISDLLSRKTRNLKQPKARLAIIPRHNLKRELWKLKKFIKKEEMARA